MSLFINSRNVFFSLVLSLLFTNKQIHKHLLTNHDEIFFTKYVNCNVSPYKSAKTDQYEKPCCVSYKTIRLQVKHYLMITLEFNHFTSCTSHQFHF